MFVPDHKADGKVAHSQHLLFFWDLYTWVVLNIEIASFNFCNNVWQYFSCYIVRVFFFYDTSVPGKLSFIYFFFKLSPFVIITYRSFCISFSSVCRSRWKSVHRYGESLTLSVASVKILHRETKTKEYREKLEMILLFFFDLGGPVVIILASGSEDRGFDPGRGRWIFESV